MHLEIRRVEIEAFLHLFQDVIELSAIQRLPGTSKMLAQINHSR
jgi:hypothetical protein